MCVFALSFSFFFVLAAMQILNDAGKFAPFLIEAFGTFFYVLVTCMTRGGNIVVRKEKIHTVHTLSMYFAQSPDNNQFDGVLVRVFWSVFVCRLDSC